MTASAAIDAPPRIATTLARRRGPVALVARGMTRPAMLGAIQRPRLTRRLTDTVGRPLVTLVAPAGYGKTTLLCDWADQDERPFAWVTLDHQDNDPECLEASIGLAVERVEPKRGTAASCWSSTICRRWMPPRRRPRSPLCLRGAPEVTLALASRRPPALPIARMRAQRRVLELGPRDLAMDRGEGAAMLALAGLELAGEDVTRLLESTEGWPAALTLGAITLTDSSSPASFGGADRLVAEYVRDEILGGLSPALRRFLLETTVLETLTGEVCDWVLQRAGSAATLVELCAQEGLLVPLDRSDERFRHHRLVAEMLSTELRRLEPERAAALHRRAGDWYRAGGDDDRAVRHALSAGDVEAAADLVWSSTVPALSHGDKHTIERWLGLFSDGDRVATPALALAAASTQFASGQGHLVEHWAHAAAAAPGTSPVVETSARIMHAALGREGLARMRADALDAYALTPDGSPSRAMCCLLAGTAAQLAGDDLDAVTRLQEGSHRAAVTSPDVHALCLTQLALPALAQGDWDGAGALLTRARAQVDRYGLGAYPVVALVLAASALVRAHRGRVEEAQRDLRDARDLQAQLTDFAAWYEVELSIVMACASIRLSDVNGARDCSPTRAAASSGCRVRRRSRRGSTSRGPNSTPSSGRRASRRRR